MPRRSFHRFTSSEPPSERHHHETSIPLAAGSLGRPLTLACGDLAAQTYTFQQNDNGQVVNYPDGSQFTFPANNAWTQPYTTAGNGDATAYTNWNIDTSYPDGNGVNAIIGTQTTPDSAAYLNASVSIQNLQLATIGASLVVNSNNSGGSGSSAVTLTLANSAAGTLQNDGAIEIDSTGTSAVTLSISNALTISGSGKLGLAAGATLSGLGTITQASTHTIQGGGGSTVSTPLVNHGLITANDYGDTSQNGLISQITFPGASITNDGTMSTIGTGILSFSGNTITNTGGLITLANTPNPEFSGFFGCELNGVSITGGTLTSTGSPETGLGYFSVDTGTSTFTGVTLTTGTVISINSALNLNGTISNSGQIRVNSSDVSGGTINIPTNVTMTGDGTIYLDEEGRAAVQLTIASGATFSFGSSNIIGGTGAISGAGTLANAGVVQSNGGQTMTFEPANCTNTGTLKAISGSILDLTGGTTINNAGGTISVADATSEVDFEAGVSITGGTLSSASTYTGSAEGIFSVLGAMTLTNVTLTANSDITVRNALTLAGTITNNGIIADAAAFNTNSSLNLAANTTINGTGEIVLFQSTEIDATNNAVLTNGSGHTIVGAPGTINANLTNDGVLIAADSYTLTQSTSSTLTNYDAATQTLTGGTYESYSTGDQTILYLNTGSVATNAATVIYHGANSQIRESANTGVDPLTAIVDNQGGFSLLALREFSTAGGLTNEGAITLDAGSTLHVGGALTESGAKAALDFVIGGTASTGAGSPGVLQVNTTATLAGSLSLSFSTGATLPGFSDTLPILAATSPIAGSFANAANGARLETADGLGSFQVNYGASSAEAPNQVVLSNFSSSLAPTITSADTASATVGKPFSYQITATNQPTAYGVGGLISGLTVNQQTGLISGTLTASGTHTLMLEAVNGHGTGTQTLLLTATVAQPDPPVVTSATTDSATVGVAFSYQITATNSPTSYGANGLPAGLGLDSTTGRISGTSTTAGTYTVTIAASNGGGTGSARLSLVIKALAPVITSDLHASGRLNTAFAYQITASNSPTQYNASGLPAGLTFGLTTGEISGKPTAAGTFGVTIAASNSGGSGSAKLTLVVTAPVPVITSSLSASATAGKTFGYQITATNNPTKYGESGLPAGLAINQMTGGIKGTPTTAGTYTVTIAAFNNLGSGSARLTLVVNAGSPAITSATTAAATQGKTFGYQITATNNPTKYGESGLPAGLAIDQTTGKISGAPLAAGTFSVTIAAFNNSGSGSAKLTITVQASPPVITSATTAAATEGKTFSYTITATNGPTKYGASGLPSGLTIDQSTGRITGTPKVSGSFTVVIAAFNAAGSGTAKVGLSVKPG